VDKLPKGSRMELMCNELKQIGITDICNIENFLFRLFDSCRSFVFETAKPAFNPEIELKLIYQTELFEKIKKEKEKTSIITEQPARKGETTAFHVGNEFWAQIFIDVEKLFSLIENGYPTFVLNFVSDYFHEILHCCYLYLKEEQEIFDIECSLVETFLGIELSEERKKMKSGDYYEKSNP
jgi:hypothetical protein